MATQKLTPDQILELAKQYAPGMEPVVMAVAKMESGQGAADAAYRPNSVGAIGPMQILSKQLGAKYANFETYAEPGKQDPKNPVHSTIAGIKLLVENLQKHGVDGGINAYFTGSPKPKPSATDGLTTAGNYLGTVKKFMGDANVTVPQKAKDTTMITEDANGNQIGGPTSTSTSSLLDTLLNETQALSSKLTEARGKVVEAGGKVLSATEAALQNTLQESKDRQASIQQTLQQFGIGSGDQSSYQRYADAQKQREGLANQILSNEQINPLKDPLGYVMGQFKNLWLTEQHNTLVNIENSAEAGVKDRQAMASNGLHLSPEILNAQLEERAKVKRQEAEAQLAVDTAKVEVQGIQDQLTQKGVERSITMQQHTIETQDARQARLTQAGIDAENRRLNPPVKPLTVAEQFKLDAQTAELEEYKRVATAQSILTGQAVNPATVATKQKNPQAEISRYYADTGKLGANPVEAFDSAKTLNISRSTEPKIKQAGNIVDLYSRRVDDAALQIPENSPQRPKNAKELDAWKSKQLITELDKDLTAVQTGVERVKGDNVFVVREANAMLTPGLEDNLVTLTLTKAKLAKLDANGWDAQGTLSAVVAEGIASGLKPEAVAKEIQAFYSTAVSEHAELTGLNILGIGAPLKYKVGGVLKDSGTTFMGGTKFKTVDLLNLPELTAALEIHYIKQKQSGTAQNFSDFMSGKPIGPGLIK